jgi:hypothetical protein
MKCAWTQIEKQLNESPLPQVAAKQILRSLKKCKDGTIYGGGFFQARIAPLLEIFLLKFMVTKILKFRYKIK